MVGASALGKTPDGDGEDELVCARKLTFVRFKSVATVASPWQKIEGYQFEYRVKRNAEASRRRLELELEKARENSGE
ncbi:MAG: hypothetical protein KGK02_05740 [Rhodospirillales bacterium]|nr:hypothetical protein [Rhodospirillales bacterium]